MEKAKSLKQTMVPGLQFIGIVTLSVLLPLGFHLAGLEGNVFIPIYLAVVFAGVTLNAPLALLTGIITPLVNAMLTGMPAYQPFPMLQILAIELTVLAGVTVLLKKMKLNILPALCVAVLAARFSSFLAVFLFSNVSFDWCFHHIIVSWPGMLLTVAAGYLVSRIFTDAK